MTVGEIEQVTLGTDELKAGSYCKNAGSPQPAGNCTSWPDGLINASDAGEGDVRQEDAGRQIGHMSGGGIMAARALQLRAVSHGHYQLRPSIELPLALVEKVCEYIPLASLPVFRGACQRFLRGLTALLARNATLAAAFEAHINATDITAKRVWVAVRVKPEEDTLGRVALHHNRITIRDDMSTSFFFDGAFNGSATQSDVWARVRRPVMSSVLQRKHVCFLAYGQTGSGKTHTMFGDRDVPGSEGVAFRAIRSLRRMMYSTEVQGKGLTPVVEFSFLEVYNEKVYDLLAQQKLLQLSVKREVKTPGSKYRAAEYSGVEQVVANGLSRKRCDLENLEEQIGDWLYEGACTRTVGKTVFNEHSSRSHAVATLHVTWEEGGAETRFYLVDLAGSERAGQYALSSEQLQQGVNINKSLSTMARVITVLASGAAEHVPYRDSTLTWLLSDAITGVNARAFMVATINPLHIPETLSTLRYAQQYSSLQSNQEEINRIGSHVRKSLAILQSKRQYFKGLIKEAGWTRANLKTQVGLNQRETHQTRHFFQLLQELEQAEGEHARRQDGLEIVKNKKKHQEEGLIIEE